MKKIEECPSSNMYKSRKCNEYHNFKLQQSLDYEKIGYDNITKEMKLSYKNKAESLLYKMSNEEIQELIDLGNKSSQVKSYLSSFLKSTTKTDRDIVKDILTRNNMWRIPIDIVKLAESEGFSIEQVVMDGDGKILINDIEKIIHVNVNTPKSRKKFTLAHELGHWYVDGNQSSQQIVACRNDNISPARETRINNFASELLMPFELLYDFLKKIVKSDIDPEANVADYIADEFEVSSSAASIRLSKFVKEVMM
ncbi:MAG: ImmA/IrrE family metallo-endopeptidase [Clostridiales bacterium]|jgi:Zn-dependent peptidase ImmA (M78 family)|nr:ImmA/IrrE family metallo-endopeptidase [Clostridiales bacterium]